MPAQSAAPSVVYYVDGDTAPPLRACLKDKEDNPIDLSGSTVTITIAFAMPRETYYTSPRRNIVYRATCLVDPDQSEDGNRGWVQWTPEEVDLTPLGQFLYTFRVTFPDGGSQTIPPNTYMPMIIRSVVGGLKGDI